MAGVIANSIQEWLDTGGSLTTNAMRPNADVQKNALLRYNEWLELDAEVLDVVRTGLVGINDVINAGLTKPLGGLGTLLAGYEQMGDMTPAEVSMEGTTPGKNDRVSFETQYVPVPIIHKDFDISLRMLQASRQAGMASGKASLDTSQARTATILVRDMMETMLFKGLSTKLSGYSLYGYTTAPYRISDTGFGDFGTAGNGHKTFVKGVNALTTAGFDGPFMGYVSTVQYGQLLNLISLENNTNELTAIKNTIPEIQDIRRIPARFLPDGQMLLVQLTKDVVDLAVAEDVTPVQWEEMGGMIVKFRIMTAMAPRIKFDKAGKCGVLHYTGI